MKGPKDPWPRVLSLPEARVVCWRPHPAGTPQYVHGMYMPQDLPTWLKIWLWHNWLFNSRSVDWAKPYDWVHRMEVANHPRFFHTNWHPIPMIRGYSKYKCNLMLTGKIWRTKIASQSDFWSSDFWSSLIFGPVMDGQTDRQKVMHKSPPCIRTGGLNNWVIGPRMIK